MSIPYVGQRFDAAGFKQHLDEVKFGSFQPKFVTLHHTGVPSLADRPKGFSQQHLLNILKYYGVDMGWNGAPHLFIDDQSDKPIIVFQRLDCKGVHAVSFNSNSWGIEMLGNYNEEDFSTGRGAVVRDNSMMALALMCERLGVDATTIKFHRDDPQTTKTCPGSRITKTDVITRVAALMKQKLTPDVSGKPDAQWKVLLPGNQPFVPIHTNSGRPIVRIRSFLESLGVAPDLKMLSNQGAVQWTRPDGQGAINLAIIELDDDGKAWGLVREISEAAGHAVKVAGNTVTVS